VVLLDVIKGDGAEESEEKETPYARGGEGNVEGGVERERDH
jgi:hypothetical protein